MGFPPIFVAYTKIIYGCNFAAPLRTPPVAAPVLIFIGNLMTYINRETDDTYFQYNILYLIM